jgi:hypothetical protein
MPGRARVSSGNCFDKPFPFEAEPIHPMNVTDDLSQYPPGDWTEDFSQENGNYLNVCSSCGRLFAGYKTRKTCKVCATVKHTLSEGRYLCTNPDGSTGTITVPTGSSLTIWTQSTIERG